jgi:hypothetical protein
VNLLMVYGLFVCAYVHVTIILNVFIMTIFVVDTGTELSLVVWFVGSRTIERVKLYIWS